MNFVELPYSKEKHDALETLCSRVERYREALEQNLEQFSIPRRIFFKTFTEFKASLLEEKIQGDGYGKYLFVFDWPEPSGILSTDHYLTLRDITALYRAAEKDNSKIILDSNGAIAYNIFFEN